MNAPMPAEQIAAEIDAMMAMAIRTDHHRWAEETDWTLEGGPNDAPFSIDITVPYTYRYGTGPSWTSYGGDPGDPPELECGTPFFYTDDKVRVEMNLLPDEQERVETWIHENPPEPDYPDYD